MRTRALCVALVLFLVLEGSLQATAEATAIERQRGLFADLLDVVRPILDNAANEHRSKSARSHRAATPHARKHRSQRLLEEEGNEEGREDRTESGYDPRRHNGGTGAPPSSKMDKGLVEKLPEGEVKDFFQKLKNKEEADERANQSKMGVFLALVLVTIVVAGIVAFHVARTHDATLDPNAFLNGNITGLSIAVGMASGLVFGFIDNAGLFFGMEYLDPVLSKLVGGHEPLVLAGYGNTFSDAVGAFLGTFAGKMIEDAAKHADPSLGDYPIWTEAVGITVGCLLGIAIPRSISGDPDAKLLKQSLEQAKELGIPDHEMNDILAKFDDLDRAKDTEVAGRVRTISLQEATDEGLNDIIRDADADGNGWVSKGEVAQAVVANKIREYREKAREIVSANNKAPSSVAGGAQSSRVADRLPPQDVYQVPGCPFSKWFNSLPTNFPLWESTMVGKYKTAWKGACANPDLADTDPEAANCPQGFAENDHNYDTSLGQGNTLGFLAGSLDVADSVPSHLRHGLFANPGASLPLVLRLSDFGEDGSAIRLGRAAFKVPYPIATAEECTYKGEPMDGGSWYGEMNLLFTESLDTFPLSDYDDLANFAGDKGMGVLSKLWSVGSITRVLLRNGWRLYTASSRPLQGKQYFTQLPYLIGCNKAMKVRLNPQLPMCSDDDASECCMEKLKDKSKKGMAHALASHLHKCPVRFAVDVQVKDLHKDAKVIEQGAATGWSEEYTTVAVINIPPQHTSNDGTATSTVLRDAIASTLQLSASEKKGAHKLFMFHPLLSPNEHRPLGEINSFRTHFYSQHTRARYDTILGKVEAQSSQPKPPYKMPFDEWTDGSAPDLGQLFGQA